MNDQTTHSISATPERLTGPVVDFFIVGSGKSGSTALYSYLSQHPHVFLPAHKEPNYFATDYPDIGGRIKTLEEYEKLYSMSDADQSRGDASICCLPSRNAARDIHEYNPEGKIIVMLRDPIDQFISSHSQKIFSYYEDVSSPMEAWRLQESRRDGKFIPKSCREPQTLQYIKSCSHGENTRRFQELFPEDQMLIIFFDDFCRAPAETYRETLQFLGLEDDGQSEFLPVNQAKTHAQNSLTRLLISPPGVLGKAHARLRAWIATTHNPLGRAIEGSARKVLRTQSARRTEKNTLTTSERQEILSELLPDIELLEKITSRDLSAWKQA